MAKVTAASSQCTQCAKERAKTMPNWFTRKAEARKRTTTLSQFRESAETRTTTPSRFMRSASARKQEAMTSSRTGDAYEVRWSRRS